MKIDIMRYFLFAILFASTYSSAAQKEVVEDFVSQALAFETPKNFKHYYLLGSSIEHRSVENVIENIKKNILFWDDNDFPFQILSLENSITVDWANYAFKNAYVFPKEFKETKPPFCKQISYSKNINVNKRDSMVNNDLHTLYLRKGLFWNKSREWKEIKKAWKKDDILHPEKNIYFAISYPIFSKDNKYALLTISKMRKCEGDIITVLYENIDGLWKKINELGQWGIVISTTHSKVPCGNIVRCKKPS